MAVARWTLPGTLALFLALCTPAAAGVAHTVEPGETLWSIAAESNLTTRALAAANGLAEDAQVVVGSTIEVPSEAEAAGALGEAAGDQTAAASASGPPPAGAYTVQPGDTLSGIAQRSGVAPYAVAAMNGLGPDAHVLAGTVLKLPAGAEPSSAQAREENASGGTTIVPAAAPQAAPGHVGSAEIGQIASEHGVAPDLAAALAWQESGFNNGLVSSANARGVMQIVPGTWSWVQGSLAEHPLDPTSPQDNVHAGVMYLGQLIADAGGDEALGVAGYYQGPASVERIGVLPDTQRYVDNVMALRSRFGG